MRILVLCVLMLISESECDCKSGGGGRRVPEPGNKPGATNEIQVTKQVLRKDT